MDYDYSDNNSNFKLKRRNKLMYMDQDRIQISLQQWLMRKSPSGSFRQVSGLPISIASDIGLTRLENQDRAVVLKAQTSSEKSFVVGILCDGMGGMVDGGKCASLAISSFISTCIRNRNLNVKERLFKAVSNSNISIYNEYKGNGGSTLSAFILDSDGNFEAINVGDSRIYLIIDNKLVQISTDDTIAGQLKQEIDYSQLSNKLLQYVGMGEGIEPHLLSLPEPKNITKMVLTSDGVHFIEPKTLQAILLQDASSAELSQRLVDISKWCGGHDNASVLLFTNMASQCFSTEAIPTGTVQIWDFFGDVQLIGVEKPSLPKDLPLKQLAHEKELKPNQLQNSKNNLDIKKNGLKKDKPKTKNKTKNKGTPNKPSLRIDFDE